MIIELDRAGTVEGLGRMVESVVARDGVRSILILAGDANGFVPEQVDTILQALDIPVFGGIFPEILYETERLTTGTLVIGLAQEASVAVVHGLSDDDVDFADLIDEELSSCTPNRTMFVFVDGFGKRIAALIEGLFDVFGLEINYIGGGAGSLSFVQKPCLFSNEGLVFDCAVLALSDTESGVGVNHGWTEVSGPYQVTRSRGNTIQELDSVPAIDIYRSVVEERTGKPLTSEVFFEHAKGFPFGIGKLGTEKIVRDPIAMGDDGSLVCVGEVPQGCFVHILSGDPDALIDAARKALELGLAAFRGPAEPTVTLFIDCISRSLALGDDFERELEAVAHPSAPFADSPPRPLVGALTLGEIANSGKDYLEFYNKTSVVGVLG